MSDFTISVKDIVSEKFPGLYENIKNVIEETESTFNRDMKDSHLWEHTIHVSLIALRLAEKGNIDPLPIVLAALFHDSGKFAEGDYHKDDIPEEARSVKIAEKIMKDLKVPDKLIGIVSGTIRSLYMEGEKQSKLTDIIHDADFLSKSGAAGIAQFFIKGTLRGENLINRLVNSATKELTYSENMSSNMRTVSGRNIAKKDRIFTKTFFRELFADLKMKGVIDLVTGEIKVKKERCKKHIKIVTVAERTCGNCSADPGFSTSFETGIKCEKLVLTLSCPECGERIRETSFCLPEICL